MRSTRRAVAPTLLFLILVSACTTTVAPTRTPPASPTSTPVATPDLAAGSEAREAFVIAMCPVLSGLADADGRLITLRQVGAAGGDVGAQASEVDDVGEAVEDVLNDLEALPDWTYGRRLRISLIGALHEIRVALAGVGEQLTAGHPAASDAMAAIPFIVDDGVELGMNQAVEAGLTCPGTGS